MAVALVMTLAQCKKTETPTNENEGRKVHITLDVSNDAKVIISPETGGTAFEQGDKVLVANAGHYVGTLTYNKSLRKFDGDLDEGLNENDYLHFYLLGNKDTEEDLENSNARPTTLTVNISDQTAAYPEIAYAPSTVKYSSGVTAYNARLLNKCALVKFTTNSIRTTVAVTITGMNNKVVVNLSDNSFEYSKVNDGAISLHAESETERWAILLPQSEVNDVTSSADGFAMTEAFTVPEINENGYLDEGIAVNLVATNPVGSINGKYTINASGDKVYFSKGNLQYTKSTGVWSFMEHQYDIVETLNQWVGNDYAGQDVVSLFCYGTSGYNYGATVYQPWSTTNRYADCCGSNLYDINQADWGYNAIANGGNKENSGWRTLTRNEWSYLFNTRTASTVNNVANARYAKAQVAGVHGVILFPDSYTHPNAVGLPTGINATGDAGWNGNNYTADDFELMEVNGAVFLPAAGYRLGDPRVYYVGSDLQYWTSYFSGNNNGSEAASVNISSSGLNPSGTAARSFGLSVRLVRNVQ